MLILLPVCPFCPIHTDQQNPDIPQETFGGSVKGSRPLNSGVKQPCELPASCCSRHRFVYFPSPQQNCSSPPRFFARGSTNHQNGRCTPRSRLHLFRPTATLTSTVTSVVYFPEVDTRASGGETPCWGVSVNESVVCLIEPHSKNPRISV